MRRVAFCWQNPDRRSPEAKACPAVYKEQGLPRQSGTARQTPASHRPRGNRRRSNPGNCRRSTGHLQTIQQSLRIWHYPSLLRLLNRQLHGTHLVTLRIVAQATRYCHRFGRLWMHKIAMAALATAVNKIRLFEMRDQLPYIRWRTCVLGISGA